MHDHGQWPGMNERALEALGPWRVEHCVLRIEVPSDALVEPVPDPAPRVQVDATLTMVPVPPGSGDGGVAPIVLDGRGLELRSVAVDGRLLGPDEYVVDATSLTIDVGRLGVVAGSPLTVGLVTTCALAGPSGTGVTRRTGMVSTTLEPQGFRRITYFVDRPANRATFDVTLVADRSVFPYLRCNGDPAGDGVLDDGRHWARFVDPISKPSYLFAFVAGDLRTTSRTRTTRSGRQMTLTVAAPPEQIDGTVFALDVLERAMAFDEANGGIEHDLDELVFVSVPAYPDATEYHGLMFFESALLVADTRGVIDDDLLLIAANVAHEYGHHVRGNRVTVRSWGQLTLKEGLTVLMGQNDVRRDLLGPAARVLDVLDLRRLQFPEELTMGAPPLRSDADDPTSLYTRTTYLKGAEVFGMLRTVLGGERWLAAFNEFVRRFDLGAAGVDDFLAVVHDLHGAASLPTGGTVGEAVDGIARWFTVPGRPALAVSVERDGQQPDGATLVVTRTDAAAADPARAVAMPVVLSARDAVGRPLAVAVDGGELAHEHVLVLDGTSRRVALSGPGAGTAVLAPLRRYSAPVDLAVDTSDEHLATLVVHDDDPFTRWWSSEALMIRFIDAHRAGRAADADATIDVLADALGRVATTETDPLLLAQLLATPDEFMLGDREPRIDVDGVAAGLAALTARLGAALRGPLFDVLDRFPDRAGSSDPRDIARRWLVEPVLAPLLATGDADAFALARSMVDGPDHTRAMRAFAQLLHQPAVDADDLIGRTFERWQHAPKLVDRWLRAQSGARRPDTITRVAALAAGPLYDRGDRSRVMAVWFPFATRNRSVFHDPSGEGYRVFVDELGPLLATNAGLAVRLVGDLLQFRRFDDHRAALLRAELERMVAMPGLPDFAVGILRHLLDQP